MGIALRAKLSTLTIKRLRRAQVERKDLAGSNAPIETKSGY